MTICRYYLKGSCRFGDRCRFEHPEPDHEYDNYNETNTGYNQERYGRQDAGYQNYYRHDNQRSNQRYEANNYYEDQRNYSPEQYQDNYRYQTPMASGAYENQQQNRYSKQNYQSHQPRYEEQNYGRNKQYSGNNYREENVYSQNRFQWLADDYKKPNQPKATYADHSYGQDSFKTSTPKGKVPFSFKVPESEIKKDSSTFYKVNEHEQVDLNMVKEDAKSWELGGQWPFTCYAPQTTRPCFPGFYDVSPEELRHAAYKAEKENSYESYVKSVQNALQQVNQQRSELQVSTPQLLATLRKIATGEDLYSFSKKINPILPEGVDIETMETAAFSTPVKQAAAAFSFKIPTETDSSVKTSAANFSFRVPSVPEMKVSPQGVSDGDTSIYTPMGDLTDEEKDQFCASTFVLGKIPTRPPPQGLCT